MIALDTNLLVRYIVQDHPEQAAIATNLIETRLSEDEPGFVAHLVLAELVWVLRGYGYGREQIAETLTGLLCAVELSVEQVELAWSALRAYAKGPADFADYLIGFRARSVGCSTVMTFDRKAARSGLHELPVP